MVASCSTVGDGRKGVKMMIPQSRPSEGAEIRTGSGRAETVAGHRPLVMTTSDR
jgi:hypothetical protein